MKCSFCGKSDAEVAKLIASAPRLFRVYICDACVAICNSILDRDAANEGAHDGAGSRVTASGDFAGAS